jgi:hypothetical protein
MIESMLLGITSYTASFADAQVNDTFVVDFDRPNDVSALGSSATLPPGFAIVSPLDGAPASSRAGSMIISWDPPVSGGQVELTVDGDCAHSLTRTVPDTGSYTFNAGELDVEGQATASCQATLTIRRFGPPGTVSPDFGMGGVFTASQVRVVSFSSAP